MCRGRPIWVGLRPRVMQLPLKPRHPVCQPEDVSEFVTCGLAGLRRSVDRRAVQVDAGGAVVLGRAGQQCPSGAAVGGVAGRVGAAGRAVVLHHAGADQPLRGQEDT